MNADHYFTIGLPHIRESIPCQDYAISGKVNNLHYAIVSDGCSCGNLNGSQEPANTDIGSRIACYAMLHTLADRNEISFGNPFSIDLIERLREMRFTYNQNDMLATLVAAVSDGNELSILMAGDGAYAMRYKDDSIRIVEVEWARNMPYYFAYAAMNKFDIFSKEHRGLYPGDSVIESDMYIVTVTTTDIDHQGDVTVSSRVDPLRLHAPFGYTELYDATNLKSVTVFSDGLGTIESKVNADGVPMHSLFSTAMAASELTSYKNSMGRFVSRRASMFLKKHSPCPPGDDFSMAGIWFGD